MGSQGVGSGEAWLRHERFQVTGTWLWQQGSDRFSACSSFLLINHGGRKQVLPPKIIPAPPPPRTLRVPAECQHLTSPPAAQSRTSPVPLPSRCLDCSSFVLLHQGWGPVTSYLIHPLGKSPDSTPTPTTSKRSSALLFLETVTHLSEAPHCPG